MKKYELENKVAELWVCLTKLRDEVYGISEVSEEGISVKFDSAENYIPVKAPFNHIKAKQEIAEKMYERIMKSNTPDVPEIDAFLRLVN